MTDPLGYTTVTDLDGQGRHTDYTDKRGVETTYTYDKFGRTTKALFNSNSKSGFSQDTVAISNFDALDRVGTLSDSLSGSTLTYAYDSLDSILSESDSLTSYSTKYDYDYNGRRISLQPTLNGVAQPAISYGYDCADELIGMSNNGTWTPPSCSPSIFVNYTGNINSSAQVAFNLDSDGNAVERLVLGVDTQMTHDSDERVIAQTFQQYPIQPGNTQYGNLTYQYDADGDVIDKGGSLAVINIPAAWPTVSYSATDQLSTWNGSSTNPDHASNITTDPASGLSFTWNARNQLSGILDGVTEQYDGLGRRDTSGGLDFEHDGSAVIGWSGGFGVSYKFMTLPGGGAVAGTRPISLVSNPPGCRWSMGRDRLSGW